MPTHSRTGAIRCISLTWRLPVKTVDFDDYVPRPLAPGDDPFSARVEGATTGAPQLVSIREATGN